MPGNFTEHNGMKLEINYMKKARKNTRMWILNNMLLNNYWIKSEIKEKINRYIDTNENTTIYQIFEMQEK